jgi:hypothetical protein
MNNWLVVGALLTALVGLAHSYLGERYIVAPLLRREPPVFTDPFRRQVVRFAWHLTSVAWWGLGGILLSLGDTGYERIGLIAAVIFLISALTTFAATHGRHLAWPVFVAISVCAWMGTH